MDDDLRELELAFRRTASPDARLALARALDRAGRADDAYALLAGDPFAPGIAAALSERPAWTQTDGDPGRTRWIDLPPVEVTPAVRWTAALGGDPDVHEVLPTPWGVVVTFTRRGREEAWILDAERGDVRHRLEGVVSVLGVHRGVLVAVLEGARPGVRMLSGVDLERGAASWSVALGANPTPALARGWLLIGATPDELLLPLDRVPLGDGRAAPPLPPAWREAHLAALAGDRAYGLTRRRHQGDAWVADLRRRTLSQAWSWAPGRLAAADATGVVVARGVDPGLALHDPEGALRWRAASTSWATHAVLAPGHVVAAGHREACAQVLDRATGEAIGPTLEATQVTGAREWVYACTDTRLRGRRLDGEAAFELAIGLDDVVPGAGRRLFGILRSGSFTSGVVCLEPA